MGFNSAFKGLIFPSKSHHHKTVVWLLSTNQYVSKDNDYSWQDTIYELAFPAIRYS